MTKTQIEKILRKCQKRLRLSDWDITLELVDINDIKSDRVAECNFDECNMEARIRVLRPEHNHYKGTSMQHFEATIWHELLHIVITPLISEEVPEKLHEQCIERIAKAMVGI